MRSMLFSSYMLKKDSKIKADESEECKQVTTEYAQKMNKARWCNIAYRYDWKTLQQAHDDGMDLQTLYKTYKVSRKAVDNGVKAGVFKKRDPALKRSESAKKKSEANICPECNGKKYVHSKICKKCEFARRDLKSKSKCPSKEVLSNLVGKKPLLAIAKDFSVSSVTVAKWCKKLNIETPGVGYWRKVQCAKLKEEKETKVIEKGVKLKGYSLWLAAWVAERCIWKEIEEESARQKLCMREIVSEYNVPIYQVRKAIKENKLDYKGNDHPWSIKHDKRLKSEPCEIYKEKLHDRGIDFIEEFDVLENRNYRIDIAFPDKKLGLEINGEIHYNEDGKLDEYYQDRHDNIIAEGWELIEIHYKLVWNTKLLEDVINKIRNKESVIKFDYEGYVKDELTRKEK